MYDVLIQAAKNIDNPLESEKKAGRKSIFDTWYHRSPGESPMYSQFPEIEAPGSGSDVKYKFLLR